MAITSYPIAGAARVTTTTHHSLSGLATIGVYTPVAGDRVNVAAQTDEDDNGIYIAASGAWSRAAAVVGDTVRLVSTLAGATRFRWKVTSRPSESTVELTSSVRPWLVDGEGAFVDTIQPDKAGEYGVLAWGERLPLSLGGLPNATEYALVGTETATVHVGEAVRLPIDTLDFGGATLRLVVQDETVKEATLVEPTTEAARVAALDATVVSALTAMVGSTQATITGDLVTRVNNLRSEFIDHMANTTAHDLGADTVNAFLRYPSDTSAYAVTLVNEAADRLAGHLETGSTQTGRWHLNDDTSNKPVLARATSLGGAVVLLCELRERVYERHRVKVAIPHVVHAAADNTNALSAPSLLDDLVVAFLDAVVTTSGSAVAGEAEGAADFVRHAGFVRE